MTSIAAMLHSSTSNRAGNIRACSIALAMLGGLLPAAAGAAPLEYNRDIRPILSGKCFKCHGPDAGERRGGLRLDVRAEALKPAKSKRAAIVPERPADSGLVARIRAADPEDVMPPPSTQKPLSAAEKATLERWIAEGAVYQEHWAFRAPTRPAPPVAQSSAWPRNDIDRFILSRLEAEGLHPAPEADRATLLRRLTLDLTGLPPTPAEQAEWLADVAPGAYERAVDRLLASPNHGERLALDWLDAARFADTNGYHIDNGRDMTLWRDWVIRAFNENLPFDRFTIEQIAGDLLPGATLEQQVASGFHRNHMINFEGGAIPEEYQTAYIVDRVNTTATVWLGLTVACAQCHDHKYDPVTQREFYQLYAFFNNVPENGLDGNRGNAAPLLPVPTEAQRLELERADLRLRDGEAALARFTSEADAEQAQWEADAASSGSAAWEILTPTRASSTGGSELKVLEDSSVLAGGPNPATDVYEIEATTPKSGLVAIRLEALTHPSLPGGGAGRASNSNFVLGELEVEAWPAQEPERLRRVAFSGASADHSQQGHDIVAAIDGDARTGWAVDGPTRKQDRVAVFTAAASFGFEGGTAIRVRLRQESQFAQHAIGRFRLAVSGEARAAQVLLPPAVAAALAAPREGRTEAQRATLRDHFRKQVSSRLREAQGAVEALRKERQAVERRIPTTMVMREMDRPRETFLLVRGQYDKRGDRVAAGVPAFLPPLLPGSPAAGAASDRLALARWLTSPGHPLVARVIANRYWQMYFGTGLVKTAEDFGSQGEMPSHPELLDWLATELASGWDLRALVRLLVTSATYRQAAVVPAALHERDPENRLLGRGSRLRLAAELIRDQALAAGGLLDRRIGGHSVSPYQPPGLWEELASREDGANWTAQTYTQSHGADLYRRGMYTFWKRTSPPPTLVTFDAPDRETCTVRRARTNTPLQALILMNDPTYVEAARELAERLLRETGPTPADRIAHACRLVLARDPSEAEAKVLERLHAEQLAANRADPERARKLLAVGESPVEGALDPLELASWALVSSAILNLDEAVTRG